MLQHLSRKWGDATVGILTELTLGVDAVVKLMKQVRAVTDDGDSGDSDRSRHFDSSGRLTRHGLESNYENLRDISQSTKQETAKLTSEAETDFSRRNPDEDKRNAFRSIVNGSAHQRREAEAIDTQKDVYLGDEKPLDAIGNDPRQGVVVADNCEVGYEEFPIDDEISTCVFESLVETECYAGSKRAYSPDLGGADVCLYYPRDYPQPDGSCRENYEWVYFQGERTCRWADLGPNQSAWYTLLKTSRPLGSGDVAHCFKVGSVRAVTGEDVVGSPGLCWNPTGSKLYQDVVTIEKTCDEILAYEETGFPYEDFTFSLEYTFISNAGAVDFRGAEPEYGQSWLSLRPRNFRSDDSATIGLNSCKGSIPSTVIDRYCAVRGTVNYYHGCLDVAN